MVYLPLVNVMTASTVQINEVRAAVDAAIDELQQSLRKINHEVGAPFLLIP